MYNNLYSSVKSSNNHRRGWYWKGKHLSLSHCKNTSQALTGRKHTPEHIKHVSIAVKKWWSKPENRELMRARQIGIRRPRQHNSISK